jgi:uncharacterized protein (DUF58 family)
MSGFLRWPARPASTAPQPSPTSLNPATWQRAEDLVALQRHAARLGLQRVAPARAQLAGGHRSRFRGRGMDYQESRPYQAGDDVRSMDWRVTARTTTPHTKLYQEERERPVMLLVQLHAGMFFGTRGMLKSALAARAAALLAWAAIERGDRVGALIADGAHAELPPRGGRAGVLQVIRQLVAHTDPRHDAGSATGGLNAALRRLDRICLPGSQVVLLGDFHGLDDESAPLLHRLRRHNDVLALQIADPIEIAPPPPARYGVLVGGEQGILDLRSTAARRAYQDYFDTHHRAVAATMRRHAIALARLTADQDLVVALHDILVGRRARPWPETLAACDARPPEGARTAPVRQRVAS